jgi:ubiquinone biosynthesis protein UbiJ
MSLSGPAVESLETALNAYLSLDPEASRRLADLSGRVIAIEVQGVGLRLYLVPGPHGVQILRRIEGDPDCVLSGTPIALARLGASREQADELFSGGVRVSGDTEVGQRFGRILGSLDVDWEEQLSRVTGDLLAHQVGRGLRGLLRWAGGARRTLEQDLGEYVQEELRLLPGRLEVEAFLGDVDDLRDEVERLEARVARLERPSGGRRGRRS